MDGLEEWPKTPCLLYYIFLVYHHKITLVFPYLTFRNFLLKFSRSYWKYHFVEMARTFEDKIEVVIVIGEVNRNYHAAVRILNERFPEWSMWGKYFQNLTSKLKTTVIVKSAPISARPETIKDVEVLIRNENCPGITGRWPWHTSGVSWHFYRKNYMRSQLLVPYPI